MAEDKVYKPVFPVYRAAQFVLYIAYRILFRFRAFGAENVPTEGGLILAPNHASFLDPPILGISLKRPVTFLAKEYLFKGILFGNLLRWLGAMPMKPEAQDFRSLRQLLKVLKNGNCVVIFPEGTRSPDGSLRKGAAGVGFLAVQSRAAVVPIYIEGTFEAFPRHAKKIRPWPVKAHFGTPFVPADDKNLLGQPEPYQAVSDRIMADIASLKESAKKV